jgi:hypothetical protein
MDPPAHLVTFAPPSETALLDFASARVSREMIREIAINDRGEDVAAYELGISKQLAPKPTLGLATWISIGEVLWLEQVSEPQGDQGHWKRLFTCTILLRNVAYVSSSEADEADFFVELQATSVIQLVRSAILLGNEPSRLAMGFLLWLHAEQSHPLLRPYAAFGILLLQIQEDPAHLNLLDTCVWLDFEEQLTREQLGSDVHSEHWLLEDYDYSRWRWTETFAQVTEAHTGRFPPEVLSVLNRINRLLHQ